MRTFLAHCGHLIRRKTVKILWFFYYSFFMENDQTRSQKILDFTRASAFCLRGYSKHHGNRVNLREQNLILKMLWVLWTQGLFLKQSLCVKVLQSCDLSRAHLVFRTVDADFHICQKTEDKRHFCTNIKGTKSDFRKISGCKISLPQNLWVQLHPLHPH